MTTDWVATAAEVADKLRADAVDRDRAGGPPEAEVELLRQSGLLTMLSEPGTFGTAFTVTRIVSAADASVGHLLGYHYLQGWRTFLFDSPRWLHLESHAGRWFWAGVSNPLDAALRFTPDGAGFRVEGRKSFATGAAVADRLVVSATRTDTGRKVTFTVDGRAPGITYLNDWDNIGQRRTTSGGVVFDDVFVPSADVLGEHPDDESGTDPRTIRLSLAALGFQLALSAVYVGIAQGALTQAAEYTRKKTRPWFLSGVDAAVDDPYITAGYGELVSMVEAARALTECATDALVDASKARDAITVTQRGRTAVAISQAKVMATSAVNEVTSKVFEFVGARATASDYGFDRYWRDARTLTLHDPVAYKAREVGENYLTGVFPPFTGYS